MLLSQTLLYLPAQLFGPMFQFISVLVWTHWLPAAEFGVLALIIAFQELIHQICFVWWSYYTIRYAQGFTAEPDRRRYQTAENLVMLGAGAAQLGIAGLTLALTGRASSPALVAATLLFVPSRSILTHLSERARAFGMVGAYTAAQTIAPLLGLLLGLAAMVLGDADAAAALGGLAAGQILVLLFVWRGIAYRAAGWLPPDWDVIRTALTFGLPLLASACAGWAGGNAIRLIVETIAGPVALGLLSVGWTLGNRLVSVAAMLTTAASFPLAVRKLGPGNDRKAALAQIADGGALLVGVLAPCTAGAVLLSGPAVDLLVGPEFRQATIAILPLAILAGAIRFLHIHFADQVFLIMERPGELLAVTLLEAAAAVVFTWFGTQQGGLVGACLGCGAAYALGAIASFANATMRYGLPLPLRPIAKVVVATALMAALLRFAPWPNGISGLILATLAGGSLYLAAIAFLFRADLSELVAARASRAVR